MARGELLKAPLKISAMPEISIAKNSQARRRNY